MNLLFSNDVPPGTLTTTRTEPITLSYTTVVLIKEDSTEPMFRSRIEIFFFIRPRKSSHRLSRQQPSVRHPGKESIAGYSRQSSRGSCVPMSETGFAGGATPRRTAQWLASAEQKNG